jgi:uncharacterized protein (DUF302 family)
MKFKASDYEVFNLLSVFHIKLSEKLIKTNSDAGIFIPMGIGIYQARRDEQIHISTLTADAQAKILDHIASRPILKEIETALLNSFKKVMPYASITIDTDNPIPTKGKRVITYEFEVNPDEYDDSKEELATLIEEGFKPHGFVMSNFTEYDYILSHSDTVETPFDFYDTYSICKLEVIYNVSKTRPQAAAYAPCSMMLYKKVGSDVITMGFPSVYNWMSSARIQDPKALMELQKAQDDFEDILRKATQPTR